MDKVFDVMIIGGGIAGAASALRAAQNGMSAVWLLGTAKEAIRSRGQWVYNIENVSGFDEGVIKKQILKDLKRNGETSAIELVSQHHYTYSTKQIIENTKDRISDYDRVVIEKQTVTALQKSEGVFIATTKDGQFIAKATVLATGLMDRQPTIKKINKDGEVENSMKWILPYANKGQILYCLRCEGHLTRNTPVVLISRGNVSAELAFILKERFNTEVSILLNGKTKEDITENRRFVLSKYNIPVYESEIVDILPDSKGDLAGFKLEDGTQVEAKHALVGLGVHKVYNDLAIQVGARLMEEDKPEEERRIYITKFGETSVENFFAVGDVALREDESVMLQVYTAQEYATRAIDAIDGRRRRAQRDKIYELIK